MPPLPFGTTIKAYGLSFENVTVENEKVAQEILDHHKGEESKGEVNPVDTFTSDLFQKAFGGSKKKEPEKSVFTLSKEDYDQFKFILLKGSVCGLFKKKVVGNIEGVKECFLLPEFSNQGLTKDLIESFIQVAKEATKKRNEWNYRTSSILAFLRSIFCSL